MNLGKGHHLPPQLKRRLRQTLSQQPSISLSQAFSSFAVSISGSKSLQLFLFARGFHMFRIFHDQLIRFVQVTSKLSLKDLHWKEKGMPFSVLGLSDA